MEDVPDDEVPDDDVPDDASPKRPSAAGRSGGSGGLSPSLTADIK